MPELPEVETTVRDLKKTVLGRIFFDVWTDAKKMIKRPKRFEDFKKELIGKEILDVKRRGKNILFFLSSEKILLVHQKLTGHLLFGKWKKVKKEWISEIEGPLKGDPMNKFLHLIFFFKDGWQLALSDLRKFAKVEILTKEELEKEMEKLGPEPLDKDFTFEKFKERILKKTTTRPPPSRQRRAPKGKIKQVLMDQGVIAGIGNIYSDEILWKAKIHPFKKVEKLNEEELKRIYKAMREILPKAIEVGGESISDYRRPSGERGGFDPLRKVYRREGEKCVRCGTKIKRVKLGQRSAHFCPVCQKL
jgi:formamidopyrimidine-DNA glycosylase